MPSLQDTETKKMIEAILFMSQKALDVNEIATAAGIASPGFIKRCIDELSADYSARDTAIEIVEIAGKYLFRLKEPYSSKAGSLAASPDISHGALKVLAFISRNNGILQSNIVKLFGSTAYIYIKELQETEFIESKKVGRSKKLLLTSKFAEYFNVPDKGST